MNCSQLLRIKQWLRSVTLNWASTTADWVLPQDVWRLIDEGKLDKARERIKAASEVWGTLDPEIIRASTLIAFLSPDGKGAI